jgi:hypothetical protein
MSRRYRIAAASLFSLERLIAFSKFLHITYTKTTTFIKGPFGTRVGPMNQRGNDAAAARKRRDILCMHQGTLSYSFTRSYNMKILS